MILPDIRKSPKEKLSSKGVGAFEELIWNLCANDTARYPKSKKKENLD